MDCSRILSDALEAGFTLAQPLDPRTITTMPEVRDMCAQNKCNAYGLNWACPPACGTVEECGERISAFENGIIVQTTGVLEDDFDFETMAETAKKHGETFIKFTEKLRDEYKLDMLALGAGGCTKCAKCTYPDAPCRFPDKMVHPMEGYGILINDVCIKNNVPYNHGRGTLTYVGCYLFN